MNKSSLYEDIYSSTNIINGDEYREMITTIANLASDMVVKTLGPYGATTIIDDGSGYTYPTKDGWSTLNRLRFNDPIYNTLFNVLKQISFNSVSTVGDGTTTAMVGASHFLKNFDEYEKPTNFRQADFIASMNKVSDDIEHRMLNSSRVKVINSDNISDAIFPIAYTATNGNAEFANIIQDIYTQTENPNIHVEMSKGDKISYVIQDGYKFDSSVLDFNVYINEDNGTYKKDTVTKCVIFDHNITYQQHKNIVLELTRYAQTHSTEIIIMAPYFDDIITTMISNQIQQLSMKGMIPNIILMQVPITMDIHKQILSDISVLINAPIFDTARLKLFNILYHNQTHDKEEQIEDDILEMDLFKENNPSELLFACLGTIRSIVIDKKNSYIKNYDSIIDPVKYNALIKDATDRYLKLKEDADKTFNGHLDKDYMFARMRYIKLTGKMGTIYVGGLSELQKRCDKDAIDDAVMVCKSAYEHGYVRGLNLELITCIAEAMTDINENNIELSDYEAMAYNLLYRTFLDVSLDCLKNKYGDSEVVYVKDLHEDPSNDEYQTIRIQDIVPYCAEHDAGFNLVTDTITDIETTSVVSSVATDLEIMKAVINILTTIITSNQFLSMGKSYDRKVSHDRELDRLVSDKRAIARAQAEEVTNVLKTNVLGDKVFSLLNLPQKAEQISMNLED